MPITFSVPAPPDRDVEVTVTLTFKESELRAEADDLSLCSFLVAKFRPAIWSDGTYAALKAL